MLQRLSFVLAIVLVIGYGILEGAWTERWIASDELRQAFRDAAKRRGTHE